MDVEVHNFQKRASVAEFSDRFRWDLGRDKADKAECVFLQSQSNDDALRRKTLIKYYMVVYLFKVKATKY